MFNSQNPRWIQYLERKIPWLSVPNLAIILVTLQALGFFFVMMDPIWVTRFALVPELVLAGEPWRLITFLALPLSTSPIWVFFTLWFLYYVVNVIENEWGAFKTTFYVLVSIILMIGFSFLFDYPITEISGFESTLFLASAALFPEMEVRLYMILPVKMKWLAWVSLAMVGIHFLSTDWGGKFYILAVYANYFIFFGPAIFYQLRQKIRKARFQAKLRK
jgi:hypothetical protein